MKMNLFNFELGTFQQEKDQLTLKIDNSKCRYDKLDELNNLRQSNQLFLNIDCIEEKDHQTVIQYAIPKEFKNLIQIKNEPKAIKVAIAKQIVASDILNNLESETIFTSLNPSNIWYLPMKSIKFAYRSNGLIPMEEEKYTNLEKYKAAILFCLTGIPYEKVLEEPQISNPQNDELLKQVITAKDTEQLKEIMSRLDDYIEYTEWKNIRVNHEKIKLKMWFVIGIIFLVGIIALGIQNKFWKDKYQSLEAESVTREVNIKNDIHLKNALKSKQYKKAIKFMDRLKYSKSRKVKLLKKYAAYQQILDIDPQQLNKVINLLYQENKESKILELVLPSNVTKKQKETLKLNQSIINYDTTTLQNELPFCENSTVLLRMGEVYLNHENIEDAEVVQNKLAQLASSKAKFLNAQINLTKANRDKENAQKDLENANHLDDKDESREDKIKAAESALKTAENKQRTYQDKVSEMKKKG